MATTIKRFEDLIIWQKAQDIAVKIYWFVEENKFVRKDLTLKDQFKRAAFSISDNIAEGFEYNNNPDFYRFLRVAKGSCGEVRNKIHLVSRLQFISKETSEELISELEFLGNQIGQLMKRVKEKITLQKTVSRNTRTAAKTHNS